MENSTEFKFITPHPVPQELREAPGPVGLPLIGNTLDFLKNPVLFLTKLAEKYGPVVSYRMNFRRYYLLTNPEDIRNFFVRDYAKFDKSTTMAKLRRALGSGLLTCPFADHKRQRRLAQPSFTTSSLMEYAKVMPGVLEEEAGQWQAGTQVNLGALMDRLTIKVAARVLFGEDLKADQNKIVAMVEKLNSQFTPMKMLVSSILPWSITDRAQGFKEIRDFFEGIASDIIEKGLKVGFSDKNFLSILAKSLLVDEKLSRRVVKDFSGQIINMLLASQETAATSLNWIFYILSQERQARELVFKEIDTVFQGELPTKEKLSELTYSIAFIKETMRILPTVWGIGRELKEDYRIGNYFIPKGSIVTVSQFVTHRNRRIYEEPLSFRPDRWFGNKQSMRPDFGYFPFGGGPRRCIGEDFAMMELLFVLATVTQKWELEFLPGQKIELNPLVTLRTKKPIAMRVLARESSKKTQEVRYEPNKIR